jgi:23S rRNA (adenine-N6)-dimethyltransferase
MYKVRRKLFSQNFLHNRKLVAKLLGSSSIGENDLVLEIGPGKGIITEQLLRNAAYVLAVEIDAVWYRYLQNKFGCNSNLTLYQKDILDFKLPAHPYKVFANIPFSIEGQIVRKLLQADNPPEDAYLVMMKEVAYRFAAPYRDNMFSIMYKPWFTFCIPHHIRRTDFKPAPQVNVVMLRFQKRTNSLLSTTEKKKYQQFVVLGFGHGERVMKNLKKTYGTSRVLSVFQNLGLPGDIKPSRISLDNWIRLYKSLS